MKLARFTPSTMAPSADGYTLGTMSMILLDYGIQVHDLVVKARGSGVYVRTRRCPVVERFVGQMRIGAVECLDMGDQDPPPGFNTWGDHPWFTDPPMTAAGWEEIEQEYRRGMKPVP